MAVTPVSAIPSWSITPSPSAAARRRRSLGDTRQLRRLADQSAVAGQRGTDRCEPAISVVDTRRRPQFRQRSAHRFGLIDLLECLLEPPLEMRQRSFHVSHCDGAVATNGLRSAVNGVARLFTGAPRGASLQGYGPRLAGCWLRSLPELLEVKRARHELHGTRKMRRRRNEFLDRPAAHAAPPDFQRWAG